MTTKREVLDKMVEDPNFKLKDAQACLDMGRTGATNALFREAILKFRELLITQTQTK
jgi:hypothetical protein